MISSKQIKEADKSLLQQRHLITELNAVVKDIERCEATMAGLKTKLEEANAKFQGPRATREEIGYLTALLDCAKKKLAWEKQLASLQKRTPPLLQEMTAIMNDPRNPPAEEMRGQILQALQKIQAAMERLSAVKMD